MGFRVSYGPGIPASRTQTRRHTHGKNKTFFGFEKKVTLACVRYFCLRVSQIYDKFLLTHPFVFGMLLISINLEKITFHTNCYS